MRISVWQRMMRGVRGTLPLALGVAPFGIAYGTVAVEAMRPWQASLMSLTVFAGTAQFVAASLTQTLLVEENHVNLSWANVELLAALPAFLVAWRTRSMVLTMLSGMLGYALLHHLIA
ncbi:MAG: AzlC family ABC transporter permease [Chloroflexota bacterium]|nr:AzlC family ABC transporter permease [Chloroflexota bacterium]